MSTILWLVWGCLQEPSDSLFFRGPQELLSACVRMGLLSVEAPDHICSNSGWHPPISGDLEEKNEYVGPLEGLKDRKKVCPCKQTLSQQHPRGHFGPLPGKGERPAGHSWSAARLCCGLHGDVYLKLHLCFMWFSKSLFLYSKSLKAHRWDKKSPWRGQEHQKLSVDGEMPDAVASTCQVGMEKFYIRNTCLCLWPFS